MSIRILTDSCCDLPLEYLKAHSDVVSFIGMPITVGERRFRDDLGENESLELFYSELSGGLNASTAQITPNEFYEAFKAACGQGDQVIYIGLSSGLSGTYNNAVLARQMLQEEGMSEDIFLVDGMSASIGQGLMIVNAMVAIESGQSAERITEWLNANKYCFHHWFVVDDLHYLKRGGRIPPVLATVGSALNLKPILTVDDEGRLVKHANVRGRKKAIKFLLEKFSESQLQEMRVIIGHGNCLEEAEQIKDKILEQAPDAQVMISNLSATIACHVGPNMLAMAFIAESRI
ncbi:MAG: DegV family protein [Clostridia bacterium]|nr:DegV family protein [Clostridia bacterium]